MAVLIVAALADIVVTIYGRLTGVDAAKIIQEHELMIPVDSRVTSALLAEEGRILLVLEDATGQQLWQVDPAGKVRRKTRVMQSKISAIIRYPRHLHQHISSKCALKNLDLPTLIAGDVLVAYRGNSKRQIQQSKATGNNAK